MVHVSKQLDLSERALRINSVVEGIGDLLYRNLLLRLAIHSGAVTERNEMPKRKTVWWGGRNITRT